MKMPVQLKIRFISGDQASYLSICFLTMLMGVICSGCAMRQYVLTRSQLLMGHVPVNISIHSDRKHDQAALEASDGAYALARRLEASISEYRPDSEIACLNRNAGKAPCTLSAETLELLERAEQISRSTDRAFDLRFASPDAASRRAPIRIDARKSEAMLTDPKTRIGVGSIGKGFIVDKMVEYLWSRGYGDVLIDAGGDLRASGGPWQVAVQIPESPAGVVPPPVPVHNEAWGSSGLYEQGKHIIDPRSGVAVDRSGSVTIRSDNLTTAGALGTACFVLGPSRCEVAIAAFPGTSMIWTPAGQAEKSNVTR